MLKVDIPTTDNNDLASSIIANEKIDLSAAHLIFSYLAHHCYYETAEAFLAQWLGPAKETLSKAELLAAQTLQYRSHLKNLILDGRLAEALQYMGEFFPQLLGVDMQDGIDSNEDVDGCLLRFKLLCQQFVEMVRGGESTTALEFIESSITPLVQNRPMLKKHLEVRPVVWL
ncbi:hypothetical protein PSACC_03538 [Paramicrosporidium saccamoebae]|uniref:CTLH domain-containing protein n=1 Tax=Paramicrosporidium saccamoebae TaxID=1246581 RepID=A0A2H9TFT4_9FUNG|nr:hypothetical protein PSACC_03538 [Paramicrosporidium saccamoebae]